MKSHLSNAAYGVLDYAAYPVSMLLAAPTLLRHLGVAQYGVWIVCTAAVSTGGIIASGFGDANIQYIASQRDGKDLRVVERAARSLMGINLALGLVMALIALALVPVVSSHVAPIASPLYKPCLWSLQMASLLMIVRAAESVCISTQRALGLYGRAVRVSIFARVSTIAAAVIEARFGHGVMSLMALTCVLMVAGTAIQVFELQSLISAESLWPRFDREACRSLFKFGIFSWIQAVSGVIFSQADRLILGIFLGATAVTSYALCVQMTQPIYGIAAAGLHFLFPFFAGHPKAGQPEHLGRTVLVAFSANLLFILASTATVLIIGRKLLYVWVGEEIAKSSSIVLAPIAWSFALLGLSVTGYYVLLALGRVHVVTLVNLVGGVVMLLITAWLLPRTGVRGVVMARIFYGFITLTMYYPIVRILFFAPRVRPIAAGVYPVCEDS